MIRHALGALALLVLGGCGWLSDDRGIFVDRRDDYLDAEEGSVVLVPEDLNDENLGDPFPIPPTPEQSDAEFYPFKPPLPDAIYGDDKRESVRIQSLGDRRWLVIPEPPATVWPKVKQFLTDNGVSISAEVPRIGRLDSQWLALGGDGYRDIVRTVLKEAREDDLTVSPLYEERLLIRVEQGIQDRTSEVHLRHQRAPAGLAPAPEDISALSSASVPAEKEMLGELGAFVAARVAEQTVSMVGQSISTQPKSVMERAPGGVPALRLNLDFDRAWATVGQALSNAEIPVDEADEDNALYAVTVTESTFTGEKQGFFGRMFSFGSDDQALQLRLQPATGADRAYWVQVTDDEGAAIDRELAQQLLVLVREFAG